MKLNRNDCITNVLKVLVRQLGEEEAVSAGPTLRMTDLTAPHEAA
ncbi:hypothetical protein ACPOL_6458 [Acidisarcina polymorpha]|uniref:Uncharacterized protein n=2 Tax=Acidobacteriaceae TaxID=204434 RepID=A0A4Q0SW03_9BACT|nr:hypothetical protein [Acidisarcina polymorpha]AXC15684.1 hypothetical protein ACPOL_6458 [Acidisarcina polymorpha]RXH53738.1 hypothetical protein GRAN_5273 [Granulicella sibirica]